MFDLGVAYQLQLLDNTRKFEVKNSFNYEEGNYIDARIVELASMSNTPICFSEKN